MARTPSQQANYDRLVEALVYYREHPPALTTKAAIAAIANRFAVHPNSMWEAIRLMRNEK